MSLPTDTPARLPTFIAPPLLAAAVVGLLVACLQPEPAANAPLETMEVEARLDADLSFENDPTRQPSDGELLGLLPGDFPDDLQPYEPSSLTDFGRAGTGRRYVVLSTGDPPTQVEAEMIRSARLDGWEPQPIPAPSGTAFQLGKNHRTVRLMISEERDETRIRIEYPAR